jgi:hypothetical protein
MFDMANDSGNFRTSGELASAGWTLEGNRFVKDARVMWPLWEAKMFHNYDHRFGTYAGQTEAQARQGKLPELDDISHQNPAFVAQPRYWIDEGKIEERLAGRWDRNWLLGWRRITGTEKRRTVVATILPRSATGDSIFLALPSVEPRLVACLCANLCSFALDYTARQKVGGLNLMFFTLKQLPTFPLSGYDNRTPWDLGTSVRDWLLPRILELSFTACDLLDFARDCGDEGTPFLWDHERRFQLRCEIDAAFFRLYSISRSNVEYILDSFPIVRNTDERAYNEFRTKRLILEIFDALANAEYTGRPYVSSLGLPTRVK